MQSHQALSDFIESHQISTDSVGNCCFEARVIYTSKLRHSELNTNIRFIRNGYEDGKIEIDEKNELRAEDYHLDLSAKWQDYQFINMTDILLIKGNSPKMGGNYTLEIKYIS